MIRQDTPCDIVGFCPYNAESGYTCEYWCGEVEEPDDYYDDCDYETGYDPYAGCFTDEC